MGKMKIAMLQTDIVWADPAGNREKASKLLDRVHGADICILPEMFSTGFCTSPAGIAEESPSASLMWMRHEAASRGTGSASYILTGKRISMTRGICFHTETNTVNSLPETTG